MLFFQSLPVPSARGLTRCRPVISALLIAAALAGKAAWAGADASGNLFYDAETNTVLTSDNPAGPFDSRDGSTPAVTITSAAAAAHRGSYGLRYLDNDATSGLGSTRYLNIQNLLTSASAYRARFWIHFRSSSTNGESVLFLIRSGGTFISEFRYDPQTGRLGVAGDNNVGAWSFNRGTTNYRDNAWHLVEFVTTGIGTSSGARRLYVDGTLEAQMTGVNMTGFSPQTAAIGGILVDGRTGTGTVIDFDDVRVSPNLQGSTLRVTASNAVAGNCTATAIGLLNTENGALTTAPYAVVANLTVSGVSGQYFSNPGCTTAATTATIPQGSSSTVTYFRATTAGTATLGANNVDFLSGSAPATISAAAPSRLVYTTGVRTFAAGVCSGATGVVTVQLQNTLDAATNAGAGGQAFTLASSAGGTLFTDAACTAVASGGNFTIPAGSNSVNVYYRHTVPGSTTFSVTNGSSLSNPANQTHTITTGPEARLFFTTPLRTFTAGTCSNVGGNVITVQLQDSSGNPVNAPAGGRAFTAASSGGGTFFTDTGCTAAASGGNFTIPAGSNSVNLYYRHTVPGSTTVTLTNASSLSNPAGQTHSIVVGAASQLAYTTVARTFTAGVCSGVSGLPITVQLRDSSGNAVNAGGGGQAFTAASSGGGAFFTDAGCATAAAGGVFTIPAGADSVTLYYRHTVAGTTSVTLTNGSSLTNPTGQTHTIAPAAASQLFYTTGVRTFTAGTCSGAANVINVQLRDSFGNAVTAGGGGQAFTAASSAGGSFFTNTGCTTAAAGGGFTIASGQNQVSLYFRHTVAGSTTISLTNGSSLANPTAQTHTIAAGAGTQLVYTTPVRTFTAGVCSGAGAVITVSLRDTNGNSVNAPSGGRAITFASSTGGTFFSDASCATPAAGGTVSIATGTNTVSVYFRHDVAGTPSFTLTNAASLTNPAPQLHTVNAAAASQLVFTTPARTFFASECPGAAGRIGVALRDAFGNAAVAGAGGVTVTAASTSTGSVNWYTDDACTAAAPGGAFDIPVGEGSLTYVFRDSAAGTPTVTLTNGQGLTNPAGQQHTIEAVVGGACPPGSADGTPCSDDLFCNGLETCQSGVCSTGTPPTCLDPEGVDVLVCENTVGACVPVPSAPPLITENANLSAGVGVPYVYNARGGVLAAGARPMTFARCGGPDTFIVEPSSGAVSWTPSALGNVAICVRAESTFGSDTYDFTVAVTEPVGSPPVARLTLAPEEGPSNLVVAFDGSGSTADPAGILTLFRWTYGDGGPLGSGANASHTYLSPGSYRPALTVADTWGRQASNRGTVRVFSPTGARPPSARIVASTESGFGPLDVDFSCDCGAGDAAIVHHVWELAPDVRILGSTARHTFSPGRYRVRLTVVDAAGLTATDELEIAAATPERQPPTCVGWAAPSQGVAPFSTTLRSVYAQPVGSIVSADWVFADGTRSAGPDVTRVFQEPGTESIQLRVVDDAGLTCFTTVSVAALESATPPRAPPILLVAPNVQVACAVSEAAEPAVTSGEGPFEYTLEAEEGSVVPEGLAVDASTGAVTWYPPLDANLEKMPHVFLRVHSPSGQDLRALTFETSECAARELEVRCGGCDAGNSLPLWVLTLAGLGMMRRRSGARNAG